MDPLDIEARKKIYLAAKKYAGSHFRAIVRASGLSLGSVQHHLHALVKFGLLKEQRRGNNIIYLPIELGSSDAKLLSLLRQAQLRKILLFLLTNIRPSQEEIARFIGISPSTLSHHLNILIQQGIVSAKKDGRKTLYSIMCDKKSLMNLLITHQESFLDTLVDRVIETWAV